MAEPERPTGPIESWVERQISAAIERGEFDNLPGAGKPIPGIDDPPDPLWWVKQKMKREGLSVVPPSLALRKEVEDTLDRASAARTEQQIWDLLEPMNKKIRAAIRVPPVGPPLNLMPIDIDRVVRRWHEQRRAS